MSEFLQNVGLSSCLVPLGVFIYRFKKLKGPIVLLAVYLIMVACVESAGLILASNHKSNLSLLNVFSLAEGIVLLIIIRKLANFKYSKQIFLVFLITYTLYWLYTTALVIPINKFNTIENVLKGILLIIGSGSILLQIGSRGENGLTQDWTFWFSAAILIYFSLTLVAYYSVSFVFTDNRSVMKLIWNVNFIAVIIANLLFSYGFLCYYRKKNL